ncbi:MAG: hypothetical protein IKO49_03445 [Bacilli bacterium]|nr:hypothetical protein [Bacilli bacterium]
MFGINEILGKVLSKKPLTEEEKFRILHSKRIDSKVIEYLMQKLNNLHIEVLGDYEGSLFQLMPVGKLMGWCWQTTESVIVFLNDNDYIERGNLYFDERTPEYYHSWICFNYNGIEYVLDPCLSFLCKKDDYSKIFEVDVKGKVSAKAVKEELIRQITAPKEEDSSEEHKSFERVMRAIFGEAYDKFKEEKKGEVIVDAPEDVNTPLYRNGAGYKTELEDGKIKKLTVHYYYTDC